MGVLLGAGVGLACGAIVGGLLGAGAALGIALLSVWGNPSDPTAGSVAAVGLVALATVPAGVFTGGLLGLVVGVVRKHKGTRDQATPASPNY